MNQPVILTLAALGPGWSGVLFLPEDPFYMPMLSHSPAVAAPRRAMAGEFPPRVMPRSQKQRTDGMTGDYPSNWKGIARRIKKAAGGKCVRCGHKHDVKAGYMLTVHHLDMDRSNCPDWNLAALCQRCHLSVQSRVDFVQQYMFPHSEWMIPYVEGFKAAML